MRVSVSRLLCFSALKFINTEKNIGIYGCRKSMKAMLCSHEAFINAVYQVAEDKIGQGFKIVKDDGSAHKFYLRERIEGVDVTEFDVPSVNGGLHNNIEIK